MSEFLMQMRWIIFRPENQNRYIKWKNYQTKFLLIFILLMPTRLIRTGNIRPYKALPVIPYPEEHTRNFTLLVKALF